MSEQRLIKNKINDILSGEKQKNAMDFAVFLGDNGFLIEGYKNEHEEWWDINYNSKVYGCIKIPAAEKELWLWLGLNYDFVSNVPADDDLKRTIWANVVICPQSTCSPPDSCEGSKNGYNIFGKEFGRTCYSPLGFFNPDIKASENIKKFMLLIKNEIDIQCTE